jgi:hypothetical protein
MMSRVDIDTDNSSIWASMKLGTNRTQTLRKNDICATVKQSDWLGIAFDWHRAHETFGRGFDDFNTHLLIKGAPTTLTQNLHEVRHARIVGRYP